MRFSEGREKIEDDEHSGQPLTARSDKDVQAIMKMCGKTDVLALG